MHISNFQTSTSGKRVVSRHIKGHALVEKLASGKYEITHLSKCFNLTKNVFFLVINNILTLRNNT